MENESAVTCQLTNWANYIFNHPVLKRTSLVEKFLSSSGKQHLKSVTKFAKEIEITGFNTLNRIDHHLDKDFITTCPTVINSAKRITKDITPIFKSMDQLIKSFSLFGLTPYGKPYLNIATSLYELSQMLKIPENLRQTSEKINDWSIYVTKTSNEYTERLSLEFSKLQDTLKFCKNLTDGIKGPLKAFDQNTKYYKALVKSKPPEMHQKYYVKYSNMVISTQCEVNIYYDTISTLIIYDMKNWITTKLKYHEEQCVKLNELLDNFDN
ncbi:hypothetical protein A3Q56_04494 [Intoshia linei]|uniref:BAR domain-containing protein n=1 Tax=Intoshia linei TaxID=1819745 RepID=A0A177B0J2_9BILA|nr:hypothetical protein A3Q56_04494 [Intoshia linei]